MTDPSPFRCRSGLPRREFERMAIALKVFSPEAYSILTNPDSIDAERRERTTGGLFGYHERTNQHLPAALKSKYPKFI